MSTSVMTPKQRAIAALTLQQPDQVPTFELEFQLEKEVFGCDFFPKELRGDSVHLLSPLEQEKHVRKLAEDMAHVYGSMEYCILPAHYCSAWHVTGAFDGRKLLMKHLRELMGDNCLYGDHADGTFSIPDGNRMYDFVYEIADDPDSVHERAKKMMENAIEENKRRVEAGVDLGYMCSDYCYNSGPFLSPDMFAQFVTPYLAKIVEEAKKAGMYVIKHTDGDIMPILDQLVECKPHALHSLDPMAGVDIKQVKEMVGDKVALCGNVNCSFLQTGTDAELIESAEYCMTHGMKNGGYIYCTSNVPFKGINPDRYMMILDVWKRMRNY